MSSSLQGTLQGGLASAEAERQRLESELAARAASLSQGAGEAQGAFQQAVQAPMPDVNPLAALIQTLGGNVASVLGETPAYREQAQRDLGDQRTALLAQRSQNLSALKDNYDKQAAAAAQAGDLLAEAKLRSSSEKVAKANALIMEQVHFQNATDLELLRQKGDLELEKLRQKRPVGGGGAIGTMMQESDPKAIAAGIASGDFPPDLAQFSRYMAGPIATELRKLGFDLFKAQADYKAFQRHYATLNTGVQKRLQQSIQNAYGTLPVLEELNTQLSSLGKRYKQTPLNALAQLAQKEGFGKPGAAEAVTQLQALANTLRFELANVYMGGGVPTDQAQKRAADIINPSVSPARLSAQIQIARRELSIRLNAINTAGPMTPSNPATISGAPTTTIGPRVLENQALEAAEPATVPMWSKSGKRVMIPPSKVDDFIKNYGGSRTRPK